MRYIAIFYIFLMPFISCWDTNWDAEDRYTARSSLKSQVSFMNVEQYQAHIRNLRKIGVGELGRMIDGMDVYEINDMANPNSDLDFPSQGVFEFLFITYIQAPFGILFLDGPAQFL